MCARLRSGARFAVVTFHSLEDRPVKHTFRAVAGEGDAFRLRDEEVGGARRRGIRSNPRARSARLRAIERVG